MNILIAPLALVRDAPLFRLALVAGAVLVLPRLGSVGLWDPWETHYAEVGRQMLARGDLVHPFWQDAWFFSKPPLAPWFAAFGLWLSGAQPWGLPGAGPLPASAEWLIRLPFAALLVLAGALLADTVARLSTRRAGLLAALAWWTMPLFDFIARQAMTDGPFVACLVIAVCCALRAESGEPRWWAGLFAALGIGLLAKGLLALLPLVVMAATWLVLDGRRVLANVKRVPWWTPLITLVLAGPWYAAMVSFDGRDDEGRRFVERFFLHDHFNRLASGVHTTTPGGTFTYFIEQGAWAAFPWVALVPVALHALITMPREGARWRLAVTWSVAGALTFLLFTLSATRFHHYVLPMLPALVVLLALGADALWDDARRFAPSMLAGLVALAVVAKDLAARPRHLLDLFTYNHERPYPTELLSQPLWDFAPAWLTLPVGLSAGATATACFVVFATVRANGQLAVRATSAFALGLAAFLSWQHWPELGRHWTQRALVDRYLRERSPGEPLAAFFMNWKGETFYSRNAVTQVGVQNPRAAVSALLARSPRTWFLVEHARLEALRNTLPPNTALTVVDAQTTNKFALVLVQHGP